MSKFMVWFSAVFSVLIGPAIAGAQTTVVVPGGLDPGGLINTSLTFISTYMPAILAGILIIAVIVAVIGYIRRSPRKIVGK